MEYYMGRPLRPGHFLPKYSPHIIETVIMSSWAGCPFNFLERQAQLICLILQGPSRDTILLPI